MNQELNNKFARLIINVGINLQPRQGLVINAPIEAVELVREIVKVAYEKQTSNVYINWSDGLVNKTVLQNAEVEDMLIQDWELARLHYIVDNGFAMLSITSPNPGLMAGVDMSRSIKANMQNAPKTSFARDNTMNNNTQWCVVAYPNKVWAKKVFPELSEEEALEKLYVAILEASHVTSDNDPVAEWNQLNEQMTKRNEILNSYDFASLHFENSLGTNLEIGLVDEHIWAGGGEFSTKGIFFNPNIPTEENFCVPHNRKINGRVVATKPLNYGGKLIEDFWLEFKDGKVVDFDAKSSKEALEELIKFDEGSSSLGEVALVPYYSPISLSNILFYNTLFDENASCHLALGAAYVGTNLKNGTSYEETELKERGVNISHTHVDFMFGSKCMNIVGTKKDGTKVVIFKDGNFVI